MFWKNRKLQGSEENEGFKSKGEGTNYLCWMAHSLKKKIKKWFKFENKHEFML